MRLMRDFPQYMHYDTTRSTATQGTPAANSKNRNPLLFRDPSVDGPKTGHTNAAGYCSVATAQREMPHVGGGVCSRSCWAPPAKTPAPMRARSCSTGVTPPTMRVKLFEAGQAMEKLPLWKGSQSSRQTGARGRHGGHRALGQQRPTEHAH